MIELGPFAIGEPLGSGGVGQVFAAVHRPTGLPVAWKFVAASGAPKAAPAFRREVEAVAALDHPHVVRVLDHGTVSAELAARSGGRFPEGSPWLVMERASSGRLEPLGIDDWDEMRAVVITVLDALAHAHARGVVHRDLKPANVLVCGPEDLRPGLKLADFGLAHVGGRAAITAASAGTPAYMAPEQILGREDRFGPWTDVYALGAMVWELATGAPPFDAPTISEIARGHLHRPLPAFSPRVRVPDGLVDWLAVALEKAPGARPRTATEARATFEALAAPTATTVGVGRRASASSTSDTFDLAAFDERGALDETRAEATSARAACPADWRPFDPPRPPPAFLGAGLGLCAVRTVRVVGREAERDVLWRALFDAAGGRARAVVLSGPDGAGSSRLARWLCELALERGIAEVWTADHGPDLSAAEVYASMATRARRTRPGAEEEPPESGGSVVDRLVASLAEASRSGLLIVRFDEAQWGVSSLVAVRRLLEWCEVEDRPVLAVLAVEDDQLAARDSARRALDALLAHERVTGIRLEPLPDVARRELVRELLDVDEALVAEIAERSGGSPGYIVSLVHRWAAEGHLRPTPFGFALDPRIARASTWLGDRGHAAEVSDGVVLAALLGLEVPEAVWVRACEEAGVVASLDDFDELVRGGRAYRTPSGWRFRHATAREAILGQRDAASLGPLHLACARALDALDPDGDLGARARHLAAGGRAAEAGPLLLQASTRRWRSGDPEGAQWLLERARDCAASAGVPEGDPVRGEIALQELLCRYDGSELEAVLEGGRPLLARCRALPAWAPLRSRVAYLLGRTALFKLQVDDAEAWMREALSCDVEGRARAFRGLGEVALLRGDVEGARRWLEEALASATSPLDRAAVWNQIGNVAKDRDDREQSWRRALELCVAEGLPDGCISAMNLAASALRRRQVVEAAEFVDLAREFAKSSRLPRHLVGAEVLQLHIDAEQGDLAAFDATWLRVGAMLTAKGLWDPNFATTLEMAGCVVSASDPSRAEQALLLARKLWIGLDFPERAERAERSLEEVRALRQERDRTL